VARRGGRGKVQVVEGRCGTNESSKKIVDIIGAIDLIAFQTNILKCHAGRRRAGEQAVVLLTSAN
jgi:methyl-accepting chemotaxis protein